MKALLLDVGIKYFSPFFSKIIKFFVFQIIKSACFRRENISNMKSVLFIKTKPINRNDPQIAFLKRTFQSNMIFVS